MGTRYRGMGTHLHSSFTPGESLCGVIRVVDLLNGGTRTGSRGRGGLRSSSVRTDTVSPKAYESRRRRDLLSQRKG